MRVMEVVMGHGVMVVMQVSDVVVMVCKSLYNTDAGQCNDSV